MRGLGVPQDPARAAEWLQKAAAQGEPAAQVTLGTMYLSGSGVARDLEQGLRWIRASATQGNADAQFRLGLMFANGIGVARDDEQAVAWYQKAAAAGNAARRPTSVRGMPPGSGFAGSQPGAGMVSAGGRPGGRGRAVQPGCDVREWLRNCGRPGRSLQMARACRDGGERRGEATLQRGSRHGGRDPDPGTDFRGRGANAPVEQHQEALAAPPPTRRPRDLCPRSARASRLDRRKLDSFGSNPAGAPSVLTPAVVAGHDDPTSYRHRELQFARVALLYRRIL